MRSPLQHCQRRAPPVATTGWSYYRCETCPKRTPPACGRPEPGEPAQRRPRGRAGAEELSTDRAWRWHFAYGANMCRSVLVRRSVRPRETGRAATLAEHELRFCHRGGFATVLRVARGDGAGPVHGVLYRVTTEELRRLSTYESGYHLEERTVTPYSDEGGVAASPVRAALYVSNWEVLCADKDLPAPAAYKAKLLQGAAEHGLSAEWVAHLEGLPSIDTSGARLPRAYFDTPSNLLAPLVLAAAAAGAAALLMALAAAP
mmetsp:Transcript_13038/g.47613  ORF Transcript_13038/g.47613 Transcript_13038/m.47613 type:complete len:260 (+) Transcript_13038:133-912(+)